MDMTFQEIGVFRRPDRPSLTVFTESLQSYYIVTECIQIILETTITVTLTEFFARVAIFEGQIRVKFPGLIRTKVDD